MRQITSHHQGGQNNLNIIAMDYPRQGEANYRYDITGFNTVYNPSATDRNGFPAHFTRLPIIFHNGPYFADMPQNGVSVSALLAIIADHLTGKLLGPDACMEYQLARDYVLAAQSVLNSKVEVPYTSQQAFLSAAM